MGVGSLKATAALPGVPAIADTVPGYESAVWWGVQGPAGMPQAITTKLNTEIGAAMLDPHMVKRLEADAAEVVMTSPEAFGKMVASEVVKWSKVARAAGIKAP